ncbi:excitatory amino acid transporter 3-like isoform X2 [Condylostylus longicornis]|uniref:excitatory amino acid transporter 3-like isoform X2 n=1 Tax=Condylostylus longicornis TaxID=2530218 RepID=UPI00244DDC86|nr:excitatory amino acid transporter 3-like isoform X2 [Condylostylus longicornis]
MHSIKKIICLNLLTILTMSGVIIGFIVGITLINVRGESFTSREISYVYFIGDIFLRILKALILPLIISSLISAIGSLDLQLSAKIGGRAIIYYIITTIIAVILGIILVQTIKPGKINFNDHINSNNDSEAISNKKRNITTTDTLLDLIKNMFPPNLIQACTKQYQTVLKPPKNFTTDLLKWKVTGEFVDGMNILGLVVASITFGIALSSVKTEAQTLINVFNEMSKIMMKITCWVIWLSPVGVIFLICSKVIELESLDDLFGKLGLFFITVAGGILFHGFVILPLIFFVLTRKNPYKFIANMSQAMATAFGTASSSATLPVTINCLEDKNNIDSRVARFVLPIGATINMDGTALYEAVAALFIAQIRDVDLTFGSIIAYNSYCCKYRCGWYTTSWFSYNGYGFGYDRITSGRYFSRDSS